MSSNTMVLEKCKHPTMEKYIPDELKITKNWVLVKFDKDKNGNLVKKKNGKFVKVPYQINDKKAQSDNNRTWSIYNRCYSKFESNVNKDIEGLGYMLSLEDNYIFIDIDEMDINTEEKEDFINNFNSYTEKSQSGKGYHIIVKVSDKKKFEQMARKINLIDYVSSKKSTLSSKHGGYEAYIEKRYFWLTGNIVNNKNEIKEVSFEEAKGIFEYIYSKRPNAKKEAMKTNATKDIKVSWEESLEMTNDEIIEKCKNAKNSEKFLRLYNEIGKDGNSETDQALMNIFAFYTQDIEQLCDLMRESPRYRGKFDIHPTYLERTADKAINLLTVTYQKNFYVNDDVKVILEQGTELPSDMNELPWILREENEKTGKIKTTVICQELAKYLSEHGNYLFVKYGIKSMINRFIYKKGCYRLISDEEFKGYIKKYIPWYLQCSKVINEVMFLLYTNDCHIDVRKINPDKYINFQNGLFNIKTWKMEEHTPKVYTTIQIPCNYYPDFKPLKKSVFDNYMEDLTEGKEEIKRLLKQFMGVTISNISGFKMKKSLFMVGKGNTGKTQIKELLSELIGIDNVDSSDLPELEKRFGTSAIYNKRLSGSNDMGYLKIKEMRIFKLGTGGDKIKFEFKGEGIFTDKYYGIFWNCCNQMPLFGGDKGDWTYERMVIVKCNNVIPDEKQNKNLVEDMYNERDYIIWQIMNSLKEVIDNGFRYDVPEECNIALEEYKITNDSILSWFQECCIKIEDETEINIDINMVKMYKVYKKWCEDNNNGYCEGKKKFKELLDSKDLGETKKTSTTRFYKNFILNDDALQEYISVNPFNN